MDTVSRPKCLIITLYSGENEYDSCIRSVEKQIGVDVEHKCFEHLEQVQANEVLFREIMAQSKNFDFFLRLDADMVFCSETSLKNLSEKFLDDPNLDHMQLPVFDVPSGTFLMGFHIFSPKCSWNFPLDPLFPDQQPTFSGHRIFDTSCEEKYVWHMQDPSQSQAYYLGIHRGSKIVQKGRVRNRSAAAFQLSYFKRIATNHSFDPARKATILRAMFHSLLSGRDAGTKRSFDTEIKFSQIERVLASSFSLPIVGQIIFQILRMRYVKC